MNHAVRRVTLGAVDMGGPGDDPGPFCVLRSKRRQRDPQCLVPLLESVGPIQKVLSCYSRSLFCHCSDLISDVLDRSISGRERFA